MPVSMKGCILFTFNNLDVYTLHPGLYMHGALWIQEKLDQTKCQIRRNDLVVMVTLLYQPDCHSS